MRDKNQSNTNTYGEIKTIPFVDAQEAWFWFIAAQQAKNDQARFVSGQGLYPRPCEPLDILKVLDHLYRQRRLRRDHFLVLRHYGRRHLAPDACRAKEVRAAKLWHEALERMTPVLEKKGIIEAQRECHENWHREALVYETYQMDLTGMGGAA